ncbi:Regulator of G-protein signaling 19 [Galemys pyrenaicus]|uniref:Regulator of G-protein signaling 19 n=1 Tax=Galemys pyrenaicus TaxID=202257 RepID=A0A8J6A9V7_GALPY|nr:Regulator of G-protein signaling 19 [Galemys pyrenaicus]
MHSPAGRGAFREFLRTEYSEENMLFWLACEELKAEANQHVVDEKARLIYEDYVSILSPKEVRPGGAQAWGAWPGGLVRASALGLRA